MDVRSEELFDSAAFLLSVGLGRRIVELDPGESFFAQDDPADSVFYLQKGRVKLSVLSANGKQATLSLLSPGDFFGEESLGNGSGVRAATAMAVVRCTALRIKKDDMLRVMHQEHKIYDHFLAYLLGRSRRTQADLVDQIFSSSEKRLARTLLLMAEIGNPEEAHAMIPPITQETLAEMVGTTRSRVSYFMNRFRALGLISYKERIRVHRLRLLSVVQGQLAGV
jgi:CRP-like cAMP-binding protein